MAKIGRFLAIGAVTAIGLPVIGSAVGGAAAHAATTMTCSGSGSIYIHAKYAPFKWGVHLYGVACQAGNEASGGTVSGVGSSDSLGLCGKNGGPGTPPYTVQNLKIPVTETLKGFLGKTVTNEVWSASSTTFPDYTPFQIVRNGSTVGQGTIRTHIFSRCPPMGTPSAYVTWTESES